MSAEEALRDATASGRPLVLFLGQDMDSGAQPDHSVLRRLLERSGQIGTLAGDIIRSKALDFLVESADVTTEDSLSTSTEGGTTVFTGTESLAAEEPLTETPDETQGDQDE